MPRQLETRIPSPYLRLAETRAGDCAASMTEALGGLMRVLAASRPGGVFLCPGDGAGEAGAWIRDGMDLSSRLVVVVGDAPEAERVHDAIGDDLRVTVHVQDASAFLEDVRDHRFDLIADVSDEPPAGRVALALARLAPGGLFMTRCRADALESAIAAPADGLAPEVDGGSYVAARLPEALAATLVARREPPPGGRRRGGRRARAGITPLFSSKSR